MDRYLVTTSDEKTWPLDEPLLFLGVWCKNHRRKHIWSALNVKTASPYLYDKNLPDTNIYLDVLFDELIKEIAEALNLFHGVSYSNRYWNILLGHWLRQYLKVLIHRFRALDGAINNNKISGVSGYKSNPYSLVTKNRLQFVSAINNAKWNSILFSKILSQLNDINFPVKILALNEKVDLPPEKQNKTIKRRLIKFVSSQLNKIYRDEDALILKTYLSPLNEVKLHLNLFQVPKLWQTPELDFGELNPESRENFKLDFSKFTGFEMLVRKLIIELLPTCYLEGYNKICSATDAFSWPKNPKFIFTSNSFEHDEGFKFWTAKKTENGIPYFVGQHGSNYGTYKFSYNWTEITTCDKFLSWGWNNVYTNIDTISAFNFIASGKENKSYDKNGFLLLIERGPGELDGPYDRRFIHKVYQQDMLSFFDGTSNHIKEKFIVRLHHGSSKHDGEDEQLWSNHYKNITLNLGVDPIDDLIKKSRVLVITYDSTSILEYLNLNIPLICFWKEPMRELLEDAVPYYELLLGAGILHNDYESASNHINDHWDKIEDWWKSNKVQDVRKVFCNRYSRKVENPAKTLSKLLLDSL